MDLLKYLFKKKYIPFKIEKDELLKYKYHFIYLFTKNFVHHIKIEKYIDNINIDLAENLFYKFALYDLELNEYFEDVVFDRIKSKLFRLSFLKIIFKNIFLKKKLKAPYEINWYPSIKKEREKILKKVKDIFFASMNNYLNSLIPLIEEKNDYILILPREAINWINYKVVLKKSINHIFLEDFIEINYEEIQKLKKTLIENYLKNRKKIIKFYYDFQIREPLLIKFIIKSLPLHLLILNKLYKFLNEISSRNTNFYIARNRRGLENAFLQFGNKISGNTYIIIHGMITSDYNSFWYGGHYRNCKKVMVWGEHDANLIKERLVLLNEKIPEIEFNKNHPFKKIEKESPSYILFIVQKYSQKLIPFFSKYLSKELKMIARLHPHEKRDLNYLLKFRRYNFEINKPKIPLYDKLKKASLVITHSSTGALEAMINDIPVLFLKFKKLKNHPLIYDEVPYNKNELKLLYINEKNFNSKIKKAIYDDEFRKKIIELNKKILNYFISI
ncbi:MAG: hypothetical protein ACP6IY_20750 [Promethearchaeia archaeon]